MKRTFLPFTSGSLLMAMLFSTVAFGQVEEKVYAIWGDPQRGQRVYAAKACGRCHAINGVGPTIGPDLARTPRTAQTVTQIAGAMWNHAPQMRKMAEETGVRWVPFKGSEMRDLIAFLYLLHFLDKPGDVRRGERLFVEKHCINCHSVDGKGQTTGPDLSRWKQYGSPILWAETMWQHAVGMEGKMRELGLTWPLFKENEMVDLISYIQSKTGKK